MIKTSLLAAALAAPLATSADASIYIPPKPAIVKPENIEFSKHLLLLGMPLTMGMLKLTTNEEYNISFLGSGQSTAPIFTASNPIFTNFDLGAAHPNREIFVAFLLDNRSSMNSASIGGVPATKFITERSAGSDPNSYIGGFFATVPTGTVGNIVLNGPSTTTSIAVWRVVNRPGIGLNQTDGAVTNCDSCSSRTINSVTINPGGFLITATKRAGTLITSSPAIVIQNPILGGLNISAGYADIQISSVTPTISYNFSSGGGQVAAAWSFA